MSDNPEEFELVLEEEDEDLGPDLSDEDLMSLAAAVPAGKVERPSDESLEDLLPSSEDLEELRYQSGAYRREGSHLSMLTPTASSLLPPPVIGIKLGDAFTLTSNAKSQAVTRNLLQATSAHHRRRPSVVERNLKTGSILALAKAVLAKQAEMVEGDEVAIIVTGKVERDKLSAGDLLARHYEATPLDGLVLISLPGTEKELDQQLLALGLRKGRDYEFLGKQSMTSVEREVLEAVLKARPGKPMRILRRTSKVQPRF